MLITFDIGIFIMNSALQPLVVENKCAQLLLTQRLFQTTPPRTLSADIKHEARYRYGDLALKTHKYIQINPKNIVFWLVFDIDDENTFSWEDKLLPPPNIIVSGLDRADSSKVVGGAHLFYAVQFVPSSNASREKPVRFLDDVKKGMTLQLGADADYYGPLSKNPLNSSWNTSFLHAHEYSLNELNNYLTKVTKKRRYDFDWSLVAESRNCMVFHELRFIAYERINYAKENWTYEQWESHLFNIAQSCNEFSSSDLPKIHPLNHSELKGIVKSVANFTWFKYSSSNNRGRAGLFLLQIKIVTKKLAQQQGAKFTHKARRTNTEEKITKAIAKMQSEGKKPSQVLIANEIGMTRQAVAKYKHLLEIC